MQRSSTGKPKKSQVVVLQESVAPDPARTQFWVNKTIEVLRAHGLYRGRLKTPIVRG